MFNRSALDNIRYGRLDATEAEVQEAARRAEARRKWPTPATGCRWRSAARSSS